MKDILHFSVPGSNRIHDLKLGTALISFVGFDLSFFKEQCINLYEKVQKKEKDLLVESQVIKEYIRYSHPYCSALIKTTFDKIAVDCIIEEICLADGMGPEELWIKNMAEKTPLEKALFNRITEYKVGAAINQWSNLRRMQKYAALKLSVIYGGDEKDYIIHKARKLYFDTGFKMAASKLGFGHEDLPGVKISSIPYLQMAESLLGNTINLLEPFIQKINSREPPKSFKGKYCLQDQAAGLVFNAMRGLKRPETDELRQVVQFYDALPNLIFEPSSLKAVIDLEFDYLLDSGLYIAGKTEYKLERYELNADDILIEPDSGLQSMDAQADMVQTLYAEPPAENQPAIDDTEKNAAIIGVTDIEAPRPEKQVNEPEAANDEEITDDEPDLIVEPQNAQTNELKILTRRVQDIIKLSESAYGMLAKPRTLEEVNMHCYQLWTDMKTNSSFNVTPDEASEWFRYMTRVRQEIGKGVVQADILGRFLDATYTVFNLSAPDN